MLYRILLCLLSPLVLIILINQAFKTPNCWRYIAQKMGFAYPAFGKANPIWIHCASVGELKAARALTLHLLTQGIPPLITVTTPTAYQLVKELYGDATLRCYLPFDFNWTVARFLKRFSPRRLLVLETEIWPNLYEACHQRGIRMDLLNGRLSKKSKHPAWWLRAAIERALSRLSLVLVKEECQISAFQQLGVTEQRIKCLGNLKWSNVVVDDPVVEKDGKKAFILLASSHADEERFVTLAWQSLQRPEPLVIVPRHPNRGKRIFQTLEALDGLAGQVTLCTDKKAFEQRCSPVTIYTEVNVLMDLFSQAKITVMGGSFIGYGGHNVWEPASVGSVIISGQSYEDFEIEVALLKQNKAIQICVRETLAQTMKSLLENDELRDSLSLASRQTVSQQPPILLRYLEVLDL